MDGMNARCWLLAAAVVFACGGDDAADDGTGGSSASSSGTTASTSDTSSSGATSATQGTQSTTNGTDSTTSGTGTTTASTGGSGTGTGSSSGTGGNAIDCNPSTVACDGPIPECPPGEVPTVEEACWGECVPVLSCATEPNCDNCQDGFCAEYAAFTVEYRCVMPTLMCSAQMCSCLAPYLCADPFDACVDNPAQGVVSCGCPSCGG